MTTALRTRVTQLRRAPLLLPCLATTITSFARPASASLTELFQPQRNMFMFRKEAAMVDDPLPGRQDAMKLKNEHFVLKNPLLPPFPDGFERAIVGTGCFWGTERVFYKRLPGVYTTAVGYAGGQTPNPTYEEVCSGRTNHNEVVQVVWDPAKLSFVDLLKAFWESHDPTQGYGQGGDRGTQYRSSLFCTTDEQIEIAKASRDAYQELLTAKGYGKITTEIEKAPEFYYAEDYHQQYLDKPGNRQYCGAQPTNIDLPEPSTWKSLSEDLRSKIKTNADVWARRFNACVFG
eukprot:TRINITY_DN11704_c0_g3_i1.p2 TRINITY_DN11704_c0_g3~~TRINITY_DN11704_c0_g3_i1.p2  ORF type:complete len:290 (+),score=69.53 TRINITY_DN11704_c0_g3_i1:3223-4092(+)